MTDHQTNSRWTISRIAVAVILALLLLCATSLGWRFYRVYRAASALRADAEAARAVLDADSQDLEFEQAISLLRSTGRDLQQFQAAARPFLRLAPHLGWVPRYGPLVKASPVFLDMAVDLMEAAEATLDPLVPLMSQAGQDDSDADRPILTVAIKALEEARPELNTALAAVEEARRARESVDVEALDPRLQPWIARFDRYLPLLDEGLRAMTIAPELLGGEGPRTYLLMVQNEDELRATGGFISGVAEIRVENGQIEKTDFEDSYAVDDFSRPYPDPPAPLRELMQTDLWLFRDSNWSPDFPTSARQAVELYSVSRDAEVDGVIALDQQAIKMLLAPLAPLKIAGREEPITGQNVVEVARRAWAPGEEIEADWWGQRKDIMGDVFDAAMTRFRQGMNSDQMMGLGYAAFKVLEEKHLLVYAPDNAETSSALRDLGWDGSLANPQGDYLMVVDTNVGFNKVNAVVEESIRYRVDLSEITEPYATLELRHRHPVQDWSGPCSQKPRYGATYTAMTRRCYYDYLRVYACSEANLSDAEVHAVPGHILLSGERHPAEVDVSSADGKTVFGTLFVVRPGQSLQTSFQYVLPEDIVVSDDDRWRYQLTVQKQPGTDARPFDLTITLPPGAKVIEAQPAPTGQEGDALHFQLDLHADIAVKVEWR